jgi:hypothetical protein
MARIPTFADLGFNDPRSTTPLPQYPTSDPAAAALVDAGRETQRLGATGFAIAADQNREAEREKLKRSRIEMALADADATGNFIRWEAAAKNETDPEKLTALTQQIPEFVSRAGAGITDPEARTLWAARTQERASRAQALADTKQLGIWQDRWEAGVLQKADDLIQLAARADDPGHQRAAGESLGQLLANLEPIHGKTKTDALIRKSQEKIAVERFAWLSSNNRVAEADKFLNEVAPVLDPTTLNRLRSGIRPELNQELGRSLYERTQGGGDLVDRIIGIESAGRADAKNPRSSATGLGQFIDSTWLSMVKGEAPEVASGKSDAELLALRNNPVLSRRMTAAYAEKNKSFLAEKGLPTDSGAIYLAHFLGPAGAEKVLRAAPDTPVRDLFSENVIDANPQLARMTAGGLRQSTARKMGGGRPTQVASRIDETTDAALSAEIDAAPASGAPIPLDEGALSEAPARPDWKGQIDRIQASDAPEEIKNIAIGRVEKSKRQFEFEQSEANNEILLRASREEITEAEIRERRRVGDISPEAERQGIMTLDRIQEQRAKAEAKLEEERIKVSRLMHRAASAGAGGPALDPKSKEDRLGLNLHYAQESASWKPEEAIPNAIAYSARYGLVPDGLQKMIRGGLHSGRPEQALMAANAIEQLRVANPQLVGEIGDEKDMRFGELILSNNRKGMPPEIAVQRAVESLKVDKTTSAAREAAYDDERGKDSTIRERSDRRWLEDKKDTWGHDPSVDPVMMAEFGELAKSEYIATGDLDAARSRAMDTISRVWGRTRVGGEGARYSKFSPEKFYGVPALSEDENADWMNEQLIGELTANAMTAEPVTPDRLLLAPSDKPAPDGRPAYEVYLKNQQGSWDRQFRWAPSWEASAEYKRRQEGRRRTLDEMRALRRGEIPPTQSPLIQSDEMAR